MNNLLGKLTTYKTPVFYAGSSVIKALASIVVSFIIARYVSPADLGLWTTISLALTYSVFIQGGVVNGLNLELPYAFGQGNEDLAKKIAAVSHTYILFAAGLVLLAGISLSFFFPFHDAKIKWGIMAITFVTSFTFYQTYLLSTFRSHDAFLKLSYIQLVDALVNIVTLILIFYYAYYGMILKAVVVLSINIILLYFYRPIKVTFFWDKKVFITLLKTGFPIFGLAYLESIATTVDKLWLIKFSNLKQIGLYSFALYSLVMITLFSSSIGSYIYPRMSYNYGLNHNKIILWNYVKKVTILISIILIPIVIIGYVILPSLITTFFPEYVLSITAMQILLIAGFFKGSVIGVNVLWSIKKWKFIILYQVILCVLLIASTYVSFMNYSQTIEGVSIGILAAYILNFFSALIFCYIATHS